MTGAVAVELADVTLGPAAEPWIEGFDLHVAPGEVVALVGPSRSGKTSLVDVVAGWAAPTAGSVLWHGMDVVPPWAVLTVIPQDIALIEELTVGENISLAEGRRAGIGHVHPVVERLDIGHLWARGGYEVSVGERQRTMVARALVGRPSIVLADEPVAHQDARRAEVVLALLRERADDGAACVLATRDTEGAGGADRVVEAPF